MTIKPTANQHGVAMIAVLVLTLLASVVTLGGLRLLISDQRITANNADHQRTMAAAQALLNDAERDIACTECRTAADGRYPLSAIELTQLQHGMNSHTLPCVHGLCAPGSAKALTDAFWSALTPQSPAWSSGASYGQFTGARDSTGLSLAAQANHARYWVEVFTDASWAPPAGSGDSATDLIPMRYRVTAIALGHQPATRVVLQTLLVRVSP